MDAALVCFSAISFLGFGAACLTAAPMRREFVRYGLARQRPLVGVLQLAGGAGLLTGFTVPVVGQLAAAGLALLMFLGVRVRMRIKDTLLQTMPAACYMALNAYLVVAGF